MVVRAWPGGVGENVTGAQVTGLAETSTGYLTAFSDIGKGASSRIGRDISNIYLSYTDKSDFSERGTTVRQIANFSASSTEFGSQLRLVPTGLDGGYILWDMAAKEDNGYFYNNGTLQYARYSADGTVSSPCYKIMWDRYTSAFAAEQQAFAEAVINGTQPLVTGEDGLYPILIAAAATKSLKEGRPVKISEIEAV